MKRRIAGFLLAVAATNGCMNTDAGFMNHQNPAMQNGAMRLASSERGPVGPWNTPMMPTGGMGMGAGPMAGGGSPIMQVGYAGSDAGILQMSGNCANGACGLPGAPPMGGMGGEEGLHLRRVVR